MNGCRIGLLGDLFNSSGVDRKDDGNASVVYTLNPLMQLKQPTGPNMRLSFIRMTAVLSLLIAASAQAEEYPNALVEHGEVVSLTPLSPWHLNFAEEKCRLSRLFGKADKPNIVFFEQSMPSRVFSMTLAGPDVERPSKHGIIRMGMRGDERLAEAQPIAGSVANYGNSFFFGQVSIQDDEAQGAGKKQARHGPGISLDEAKKVDRIVMQKVDRVTSWETGNMEAPFRALNACTLDLLEHRGLDPDQHRIYVPPAPANEREVVERLKHHFARSWQSAGDFALVRVQLIVETDGRASACYSHYVAYSGEHRPDPCEQMRGLQFEPALDADGEVMRSFYTRDIDLNPWSPWTADAHGGRWGS